MLEELRFFLVILEEGSLRRAAKRLHISQPALTRQMQLLEHDLGGRILERTSAGVYPTSEGHALAEKARALLGYYDSTMAEARRMVRGESERLRVGYLASAGQEYLGPALSALRRLHPEVKTKLLDLTTGEQIMALRRGEIDLALTYLGRDLLSRDFCTRKVATVPSLAALPSKHRLASQTQISISQLKNEHFLRVPDTSAPGYNQKISQFAFNSADSDPDSRPCGTSQASPRGSRFPLTKTRFRCIRFLFPTSGYRTSSWFPLPIRARPGIYLLPGNEAKPPVRCALCWTRLLLNLADLRKCSANRIYWL